MILKFKIISFYYHLFYYHKLISYLFCKIIDLFTVIFINLMYPCWIKVLVEVKKKYKLLIKTVWTGEYIIDYANIFLSLIFFFLGLKKRMQ